MLAGLEMESGVGTLGERVVARVEVQAPRSILSKSRTPSWVVVKPEQSGFSGVPQGFAVMAEEVVAVKEQRRVVLLQLPRREMLLPSLRVIARGAEMVTGVVNVVQLVPLLVEYFQ